MGDGILGGDPGRFRKKIITFEDQIFCMNSKLFFLLGSLVLISCNKSDAPEDLQCFPCMPSPHRIATESIYSGPDTTLFQTTSFIYDPSGRLIYRLTAHGGTTDTTERYTYYHDSVVLNSVTYKLNDHGKAVSLGSFFTWKYNPDGYLTEEIVTFGGGTTQGLYNYTCFNPDRVIIKNQMSAGTYTDTIYYQYYADKINTIGNQNHGILFLGRQDNTLRKSETINGVLRNPVTYVFDSENRVQWKMETDREGNITYVKYTYL